ncbi:MAG: hypothetical protein IT548_07110 [Alphaproteobacteria bacterium]|nr:hypothetical protein [Alphaproteobacteria bacterium]
MGQMLVRAIPDELIAKLKERARQEGVSAEALARRILMREAILAPPPRRMTYEEALARMDQLRAMTPAGPPIDTAALIREFRDKGYEDDD